jgi:hypothetical protein
MAKLKYIIGITGAAFSGKTTVAIIMRDQLLLHHDSVSDVVAFADKLKDECAKATGMPREWFDSPEHKEMIRPLMQWWGTEFRRNNLLGGYDNYWIDAMHTYIHRLSDDYEGVIIPDVRFDNEAKFIVNYDADVRLMVKVTAPNASTTVHSSHASEHGVDPYLINYTLENSHNGLPKLRTSVYRFLNQTVVGNI